ncbi:hypothetical protein F4819DRAFT_487080 [Hypoxylon fuscum]|nr:hypothetical protein F4819DRAFT_487080 [Hypoxylon fuscum]
MTDETNYVATVYAVSWALGSLVIIICTVRVFGRAFIMHQTGWDDFFMSFGALSAIVCSALVTTSVFYGLGRHKDDIKNPHDLSQAIKYTVIAPVLSIISSSSSKISILIFLIRLMGITANRWHIYFLWGMGALLVLLNIMAIVVILRFCSPVAFQWDKSIDGTCINPNIQLYSAATQSAYNALLDIIVAIFPATFITKLNTTRKMKVGLFVLMGGGFFASAATMVKVYLIKDLDKHGDITWFWAPIALWFTAEMDIVIILGTMPTLWPMLNIYRRRGGNRGYDPYIHLESSTNSKTKKGPMTRVLQGIDDMRTAQTIVDRDRP